MDRSRVLIVYYSRGGTTRAVAEALRHDLACDCERIEERAPRVGFLGYLKSIVDTFLGRPAKLLPMVSDPKDFDLLLIGSPVWNADVSTPVRAYLGRHRNHLPRIAFFCTHATTGSARAIHQVSELCGQTPVLTLDLRSDEVHGSGGIFKIRSFVSALISLSPSLQSPRRWRPKAVRQTLEAGT